MRINILVPMAGAGSRFQQAGYTTPKPFIKINDKELVRYALDNVCSTKHELNFILVARKSHLDEQPEAVKKLTSLYNCTFVEVDSLTEGAACTTLLARHLIDNDTPLFIINCDQLLEWNPDEFYEHALAPGCDGSIVTIETSRRDFSFAKVDEHGRVTLTAEKNPISTHGTVGYYFWRSGKHYVSAADVMISSNKKQNGEFYVCPVYNEAIDKGMNFQIFPVEKMWCLGTPEDVERFKVSL